MFEENHWQAIRSGKIGVIPTDTVYGLVASAFNESAIERVFSLKTRAPDRQCIILISNLEQLNDFGVLPEDVSRAMGFWEEDGATSIEIVVPETTPWYQKRGLPGIAFRLPRTYQPLVDFIEKSGPIVAPSANPQGQPNATTIEMAKKYFGDDVDFYVDGGVRDQKPSRVIRLEPNDKITIKRS